MGGRSCWVWLKARCARVPKAFRRLQRPPPAAPPPPRARGRVVSSGSGCRRHQGYGGIGCALAPRAGRWSPATVAQRAAVTHGEHLQGFWSANAGQRCVMQRASLRRHAPPVRAGAMWTCWSYLISVSVITALLTLAFISFYFVAGIRKGWQWATGKVPWRTTMPGPWPPPTTVHKPQRTAAELDEICHADQRNDDLRRKRDEQLRDEVGLPSTSIEAKRLKLQSARKMHCRDSRYMCVLADR